MLRKTKYLLKREALSTLYTSFIRPILEYSSEVWDSCSTTDSERLEKIQLEAARIVTGLPMFAPKTALYYETGWETLEARRKNKKLRLMYQITHGNAPAYLNDVMPPFRSQVTSYPLRNINDITIPQSSLDIYKKSFISSTIRDWNELNSDIRNSPSISTFKNRIASKNDPPKFFCKGARSLNILHTKLTHNCSALNSDLFRVNLINDTRCTCGVPVEDCEHYFMFCTNYNAARQNLFMTLRDICHIFTLNTLLFGDKNLNTQQNEELFLAVQTYIKDTKRF